MSIPKKKMSKTISSFEVCNKAGVKKKVFMDDMHGFERNTRHVIKLPKYSKYESNSNKIKDMDIIAPNYKLYANLKKVITERKLLVKLGKILGVREKVVARRSNKSQEYLQKSKIEQNGINADYPEEDYGKLLIEMQNMKPEANMYQNFLNYGTDRWYEETLLEKEDGLEEKAKSMTDAIIKEYVDWMDDTIAPAPYDGKDLKLLFAIGMDRDALPDSMKSLHVDVHELNAVDKSVAEENKLMEFSKGAMLYKQLYRDVLTAHKRKPKTAFGRAVPIDMLEWRHHRNFKPWLVCKRIPDRLKSMAVVFDGIEATATTKGYCRFLRNRPDIMPPKYLSDLNLLRHLHRNSAEAVMKHNRSSSDIDSITSIDKSTSKIKSISSLQSELSQSARSLKSLRSHYTIDSSSTTFNSEKVQQGRMSNYDHIPIDINMKSMLVFGYKSVENVVDLIKRMTRQEDDMVITPD